MCFHFTNIQNYLPNPTLPEPFILGRSANSSKLLIVSSNVLPITITEITTSF